MARLTKVYFSAFHNTKPHRSEMQDTEIRTYAVDWNGALEGSTASSATWSTDDDSVIAITGAALSAGIATVTVEALVTGTAHLSCAVTLANDRKLLQWFRIRVKDEADIR